MLIRYAEGQQRSGRLGATIASHNRFGAYYRAGTVPVNPQTARQTDVRNEFKALAIRWAATLTQAQRDAWDVYAANVSWVNRFGDAVNITGENMYIRTNSSRKQVGLLVIDAAPAVFDLAPAELSLGATASAATQDLAVAFDDTAAWVDLDGAYQAVFVGLPKNPSVKFFNGPWRFADVILGDAITAPTTPATIASPFAFQEGQRLFIKSRVGLDDGRLSTEARFDFLGAA